MSLYSTDNQNDNIYGSQSSLDQDDVVAATIQKLKAKLSILQKKQQRAIEEFQNSQILFERKKIMCEQEQERNEKMNKKINHFETELKQRIDESIRIYTQKHRDLSVEMQDQQYKQQELQNSLSQIRDTNRQASSRAENILLNIKQQADQSEKESDNLESQIKKYQDQIQQFNTQLGQLIGLNQKQAESQNGFVMQQLARFGDEDYSVYVGQIMATKQIARGGGETAQNLELLSRLSPGDLSAMSQLQKQAQQNKMADSYQSEQLTNMLLNKNTYGGQWQVKHHRPTTSQDVQVNTPVRNMAASITVFDEKSGKDVTFQQTVQPNTPIIRGNTNGARYIKRDETSFMSGNAMYEPTIIRKTRPQSSGTPNSYAYTYGSTTDRQLKQLEENIHRTGSNQKKLIQMEQHERQLKLKKAVKKQRQQTELTTSQVLRTKGRDDIIYGLECKIQDAREAKKDLERRLEAVQKSYVKGPDKTVRVNAIKAQISSRMVDIKQWTERLSAVRSK